MPSGGGTVCLLIIACIAHTPATSMQDSVHWQRQLFLTEAGTPDKARKSRGGICMLE